MYVDLHKARGRKESLPIGTFYVLHFISELLTYFHFCGHDITVSVCICVCPTKITLELIQELRTKFKKIYTAKLSNTCSLHYNSLTNCLVQYISQKICSSSTNSHVSEKFKLYYCVKEIVLIEQVSGQLMKFTAAQNMFSKSILMFPSHH